MHSTEPRRQSALFRQMAPKLRRRRPFLRLLAPPDFLAARAVSSCPAWKLGDRREALDAPPFTPPQSCHRRLVTSPLHTALVNQPRCHCSTEQVPSTRKPPPPCHKHSHTLPVPFAQTSS